MKWWWCMFLPFLSNQYQRFRRNLGECNSRCIEEIDYLDIKTSSTIRFFCFWSIRRKQIQFQIKSCYNKWSIMAFTSGALRFRGFLPLFGCRDLSCFELGLCWLDRWFRSQSAELPSDSFRLGTLSLRGLVRLGLGKIHQWGFLLSLLSIAVFLQPIIITHTPETIITWSKFESATYMGLTTTQ